MAMARMGWITIWRSGSRGQDRRGGRCGGAITIAVNRERRRVGFRAIGVCCWFFMTRAAAAADAGGGVQWFADGIAGWCKRAGDGGAGRGGQGDDRRSTEWRAASSRTLLPVRRMIGSRSRRAATDAQKWEVAAMGHHDAVAIGCVWR